MSLSSPSSATAMRDDGVKELLFRRDSIGSAVGLTEEVISFAMDVSMHPDSWLDFPLPDKGFHDFVMSDVQKEHAMAVQRLAPRLAALRVELCPKHMSEGCFWKIYFSLLHARLGLHDAVLLSTPQIEESRKHAEVISETTEQQHQPDYSKGGKGKRLWKKVKYQLVEYHSLPAYLRDNEYILRHYRSEWPLKQALLSIFSIHNETLNIWTHLIGFFLFLSLTIYTAMKVPDVVHLHSLRLPEALKADLHKLHKCLPSLQSMPDMQRLREELKTMFPSIDLLPSLSGWHIMELLYKCLPGRFSNGNNTDAGVLSNMKEEIANLIVPQTASPITRWPFFAFLGGAMFCLLGSSTCHLLSCHSQRMSYIMLRIDYTGIAALIATSFYPPVYYSFMCDPFFCNLYLGCITVLGIATMLVSLLPMFQSPQFRKIRAILFAGMGLSGIFPILHKLILFRNQPEALYTTGYEVLMGALYGIGAFIYVARIPERWMPGKFDIAGHSHQLFHIFVVAGAYTHYHAGLIYLKWRDLKGC